MTRVRIPAPGIEADVGAESAAITKALKSLLAKAKKNGCTKPILFFESESAAVFVMDDNNPKMSDGRSGASRQEAIVLRCPIFVTFDTGSW